jgi:hypothetical protein
VYGAATSGRDAGSRAATTSRTTVKAKEKASEYEY